jgi:hypothetical protein
MLSAATLENISVCGQEISAAPSQYSFDLHLGRDRHARSRETVFDGRWSDGRRARGWSAVDGERGLALVRTAAAAEIAELAAASDDVAGDNIAT